MSLARTAPAGVVRAAVRKLLDAQDLLDGACAELLPYTDPFEGDEIRALNRSASATLGRLLEVVLARIVGQTGDEQARRAEWDAAIGGKDRS